MGQDGDVPSNDTGAATAAKAPITASRHAGDSHAFSSQCTPPNAAKRTPWVLGWPGMSIFPGCVGPKAIRMAELEARLKATRTALDRLDGMCEDENVPARSRERLREIYEERIRRYESGLEAGRVTDEYQ